MRDPADTSRDRDHTTCNVGHAERGSVAEKESRDRRDNKPFLTALVDHAGWALQ